MGGDLNMGTKRITNVADPVGPQDVVTVNYLEQMVPINREPIGSTNIIDRFDLSREKNITINMSATIKRTIKLLIIYGVVTDTVDTNPDRDQLGKGIITDSKRYKLTKMLDVNIDNSHPYTEFIELITNIGSRYLEIQPFNIDSTSITLNLLNRNNNIVAIGDMQIFVYRCIS